MGILQVSYILGSRGGSSAPNEPLWLRGLQTKFQHSDGLLMFRLAEMRLAGYSKFNTQHRHTNVQPQADLQLPAVKSPQIVPLATILGYELHWN